MVSASDSTARRILTALAAMLIIVACFGPHTLATSRIPDRNYQIYFQQKPVADLSGRVVDARTGEPIVRVKVIVSGTEQSTTTDDQGLFAFHDLPAGVVDLYITTITFGLVKKSITLKAGANPDVQIARNEDAAALTESVTVNATPFETTAAPASQQILNKQELQQLSSVLIGDPIRAAQSLPGVSTN